MNKKNHAVLFKKVGSAFVVPLADGRHGAIRVLKVDADRELSLFAATQYIDTQPPRITEPLLKTILVANKVFAIICWGPCVKWQYWIEPPPETFRYLGVVEPDAAEDRFDPGHFSKFWDHWPKGILAEWQWRHDRAALEAEQDRIFGGPGAFQRFLAKRKKELEITLEQLKKKNFFRQWKGEVSPAVLRESNQLMREAVESLSALGRKPTKKLALPIVRRCIEGFNQLNQKSEFIFTIEREDIMEQLYQVLEVAGLRDFEDWADQWRDW